MSDRPHHAHQPDPSSNGLAAAATAAAPPPSSPTAPPGTLHSAASKRQRRPSVRLGEIGEQPASVIPHESYIRRCKQLNVPVPAHYLTAAKLPSSSKTRPLTHLVRGEGEMDAEREHLETVRAAKVRRGAAKRVKSNLGSRGEEEREEEEEEEEEEEREFGASVSPVKERNWGNGRWFIGRNDGRVKAWLGELGLERYAPVFEIHEVDDEVLHLLTLEDLKDMGISAVGSRRKMYHAIQKLREGFRQ